MTNNQIFEQLGIENSDDAFKAHMLGKIMATADLRFAHVLDELMTDEERREFEAFSKGKDPEAISGWVGERYEDAGLAYSAIVESVVDDLKRMGGL